ncbi:MAG TPA: beta-ketoacyl-ACP synthase III [Desulfobacteria bacterium]|nr:beta-ketoacyl-ACP synthase III [Desulfobacteria bacterium]
MPRGRIVGTGSTAPKRILSNLDLEGIVDTNNEWIVRRSGIEERRISSKDLNETTTDLATQASKNALEMAGVSPAKLDMIVAGTVTPDRQFPSAACMVQETLNAKNAAAFDVSAGCSGFLYALSVANNAIQCGNCKTALVMGVERLSTIVNWEDRGTCVLLGDGAGAIVLTSEKSDKGILSTHLKSDGSLGNLLYSSEGKLKLPEVLSCIDQKSFHLKMEGNRLFKRAINCLTDIAREALTHNSMKETDVDTMIPHQANIRIIQATAKNLDISMDKVYTNLQRYGNTSSASIPIAMDEANREGFLRNGTNILLVSFGAGLTWGASLLKWAM